MTDEKKEITLEELTKSVGEIASAVKEIKEPNYDEMYKKMEEIVDAKVKDLKEPIKDKKIDAKDGADEMEGQEDFTYEKGKFSGLKVSQVQLTDQICKAFAIPQSTELQKAMSSTGANVGDEWVPTQMQASLWRDFNEKTLVADKFDQIDMPSNPFDIPIETGDIDINFNSSENTATSASDVPTDNNTITARKLMGEVNFSYELTEDSILAVIGIIQQNMARAFAKASDYVVLHGDQTTGSTNITYDGSAIAATHKALVFDGLRHAGVVDNTSMKSSLGALGTSDLLTLGALQAKYFTEPGDNVVFMDIYTYFKTLALDDFRTIDKYGAGATIIRGELGKWYGVPIIASNQFGKTNSAGKIEDTAGDNTKGSMILTHLPSWKIGWRRRIMLESDKNIQKQQHLLVISARMGMLGWGTMASQTHTVVGYNVTV